MQKQVALTFAALFLFALNTAIAQQLKDSTDRFTGVRVVKYEGQLSLAKPFIAAAVKEDKGVVSRSLAIMFSFKEWKYLQCHSVHWLVDGVPLSTEPALHNGKAVRGGVVEQIYQPLTEEQFSKIAAGSKVEYKICNDEYEVSAEDVVGIKSLYSQTQSRPWAG